MKHVFVLGKEAFNQYNPTACSIIDALAKKSSNANITYHVSCLASKKRFLPSNVNNTTFFSVRLPKLGFLSYLIYDVFSLYKSFRYIKKHAIDDSSILLFSSRAGVLLPFFDYKFKKFNTTLFIYCERNTFQTAWTFFIKKVLCLSEYFCVQYSDVLLSTDNKLTSYFKNTYAKLHPSITTIPCDSSTFDWEFYSFLKQIDSTPYDYYFMLGDFSYLSNIVNVLTWFTKCNTTKKLILLSKKDLRPYKIITPLLNLHDDKRIIILNTSRFQHLTLHLIKYCHAFIHHTLWGIKKNFEPYYRTTINLVMDTTFNRHTPLPNTLYFTQKNFSSIITEADSTIIPRINPNLNPDESNVSRLIQNIENLF